METATEIDYRAEYLALATRVRRTSQKILAASVGGSHLRVQHMAGELCTEMTAIVQRAAMQDESTGEDRYSLAELAVDPSAPTNSELPYD